MLLSADIIIKQTVSLSPEIVLEENTDIEAWDAVIENNDELLEKYIAGEPISREKLARRNSSGFKTPPVPSLSWQRQKWPWHSTVDGCGDRAVPAIGEQGRRPMRRRFQVEYRLRPAACHLRLQRNAAPADTVALAGRES